MSAKTFSALLAGALLITLAGCSSPAPEVSSAPSSSAPAPEETPEAEASLPVLSDDELGAIFTDLQFVPDQFASTGELMDSIYPGLAASDLSCLAPFGVGWDSDTALVSASLEYGTSNDRSMTAVVASTGDADAASTLVSDAKDAIARCAEGADIFEMQGKTVSTTVEETTPTLTGTDEAIGWTVTGTVGGSPFTLVGLTARVGGNVVALVGWDPSTNETYVPLATQMFVDAL